MLSKRELPYEPTPIAIHFLLAFLYVGLSSALGLIIGYEEVFRGGERLVANESDSWVGRRIALLALAIGFAGAVAVCYGVIVYRRRVIEGLPDDSYFTGEPNDYEDWTESTAYDAWVESNTYDTWADWDPYGEYAQ